MDRMYECPFCKASITEAISRYGGHCAQCLIEIPGEEAVTDPGAESTNPDAGALSSRGPLLSGVVAAAVVLGTVGVWWSQQVNPVPRGTIQRGFKAPPVSDHQDQPLPQAKSVEELAEASDEGPHERSERRNRTGGKVSGDTQEVAEGRVIPAPATSQDPFAFGSGIQATGPQGIVLTDPNQIESMVNRVLQRGHTVLEPCYNERVRSRPGFQGRWKIFLEIGASGTVSGIDILAKDREDAVMERCIRSKVSKWAFQATVEGAVATQVYSFPH